MRSASRRSCVSFSLCDSDFQGYPYLVVSSILYCFFITPSLNVIIILDFGPRVKNFSRKFYFPLFIINEGIVIIAPSLYFEHSNVEISTETEHLLQFLWCIKDCNQKMKCIFRNLGQSGWAAYLL